MWICPNCSESKANIKVRDEKCLHCGHKVIAAKIYMEHVEWLKEKITQIKRSNPECLGYYDTGWNDAVERIIGKLFPKEGA